MNNKSTSSSVQYSRLTDPASIIQKMKEEADYYTRMEQVEKHQRESLNTVHEELFDKLKALRISIAQLEKDCEMGNDKRANVKTKNLLKDIQINDKKKNDTLGDVDKLKKVIELARQEQILIRKNLKGAEEEMSHLREDTRKLQDSIQHSQVNSKTSQNLMIDLKGDNQEDRYQNSKQWANLSVNMRESKLSLSMVSNDKRKKIQSKAFLLDTAPVLKKKLTRLIRSNKEKVRLIQTYQKNMKIIQGAFQSISQATGVMDIQEIQATFIKGEQQNYGLLTYVDVLDQQIDTLNDQNQSIRSKIQQLRLYGAVSRNQILQNQSSQQEQEKSKRLDGAIKNVKQEINIFESFLGNINPSFESMIIELCKSKFNQTPHQNASLYQLGGVNLNELTLDAYLDEVQTYTNQILFFKGKQQNRPNSQIFAKSLLLGDLEAKQFKKRVVQPMSPKEMMIEDMDSAKELLTEGKLSEIAVKEIERYKVFGNQERIQKK